MSSNNSFKLKPTPVGWIFLVLPFAGPWIIPGLVSLSRGRSVHMTAVGYVFFWVLALLGVFRQVRVATVLEEGGIRIRRTFSAKFVPWNEITGVEIRDRGRLRLAQVETSSGQLVRLPAPIAGGGMDGSQFDAQVDEIEAAWAAGKRRARRS